MRARGRYREIVDTPIEQANFDCVKLVASLSAVWDEERKRRKKSGIPPINKPFTDFGRAGVQFDTSVTRAYADKLSARIKGECGDVAALMREDSYTSLLRRQSSGLLSPRYSQLEVHTPLARSHARSRLLPDSTLSQRSSSILSVGDGEVVDLLLSGLNSGRSSQGAEQLLGHADDPHTSAGNLVGADTVNSILAATDPLEDWTISYLKGIVRTKNRLRMISEIFYNLCANNVGAICCGNKYDSSNKDSFRLKKK
eukprot:752896_1